MNSYSLFPTHLGKMGFAWNEGQILGIKLPVGSSAKIPEFLQKEFSASRAHPPGWVQNWIERIQQHLLGLPQDFSDAPLAWDLVPNFHRQVYLQAQKIPAGQVISYSDLAQRLDNPGAARAVGQALKRNPFPIVIPCHRIICQNSSLGGFMGALDNVHLKQKILQLEKAKFASPDLEWDAPSASLELCQRDPQLADFFTRIGPFNLILSAHRTPYESLFRSIVYQQLTGQVAAQILGRVLHLFDDRFPAPDELLKTSIIKLRSAGLSEAKVRYLKDLARNAVGGTIPNRFSELKRLDNEQIIERLTHVQGVGRWTVEMMLLFRMGRPDVFPLGDYAVCKAMSQVFHKGRAVNKQTLQKRAELWRPFRTIVSWYLWRHHEIPSAPLSDI